MQILTTPGEKGRFLIKLEVTDTRDMKGISKNGCHTKDAFRSINLLSQKYPWYIQIHKISVAKDLSFLKNVKKDKFSKFNKFFLVWLMFPLYTSSILNPLEFRLKSLEFIFYKK